MLCVRSKNRNLITKERWKEKTEDHQKKERSNKKRARKPESRDSEERKKGGAGSKHYRL